MKKITSLLLLSLFAATSVYSQSTEKGFSFSGTTAYVAGDFDYAGFYGLTLGGDIHLTLTDSEKVDVALSAGYLHLLGLDGIPGEGFFKAYGNLLVNDLLTEGQHFGIGAGYASSQSERIEVKGLYLEAFYQFELSDRFALAPGAYVIIGIPDLADTVSSNVVVLGLRGTFKL